MDEAIAEGGIELQRWIPAVDPQTGFFAAYNLYCEPPGVCRVWGVAMMPHRQQCRDRTPAERCCLL